MKTAVICIVPTDVEADRIVAELHSSGFSNNDISALLPDKTGTKDLAHKNSTKAPEGATAGASTGAVLGGALGLLAGIGALAIPGVGPLVAAGPIMAALSGAAVGGAAGGLTGGLIGMGIPEYEAKQYEGKVRDGNILLSVHTESAAEAKRAEEIFKANNAHDIKRTGEESVKR
jgi:uncharacterized membrane protein